MKFSYRAVWADTVATHRNHGPLIAAVAGVFLFLPALLIGYAFPQPETSNPDDAMRLLTEYWQAHWHWYLLSAVVSMIGTLAIMALVFRRGSVSVGGAIAAGAALLPFYLAASILAGIPIFIGFLLLIVPGLYLFARFAPLAPVMVSEGVRSPLAALGRTWTLTKGHGWAVLGIFLLVGVAGAVLLMVFTGIVGLILTLALPEGAAGFLLLIIGTAASTVLQVVLILLYAAVYRALAGTASADHADQPGSGPIKGI